MLTGKVHALVKDRHRSREFIEFLKLLDAAYPARAAIKLILDNHSAHISRETRAWLDTRPAGHFQFTFTPEHGSWLNPSRASSPSSPAQSCVTSGLHQSMNSRSASWPKSTTSIAIPSSILGPTSSPTPPDMIRTKQTLT
ncbi:MULTISPECIES: transposase [Bradyrhizobium]|uniref:transposase n=1 Tax=Bradyrhizobium centrosematis TaxID=1300039 RepID=UPI0035B58C03